MFELGKSCGDTHCKSKPKVKMRFQCGKFSRRDNYLEHQSFLPFARYSENHCGECPHKGFTDDAAQEFDSPITG